MRRGQVADVDIIADAGPVGGRIIGAVDRDMVALADRRLDRDLDQVRRALADLPRAALRIGAGDVEIAQRAIVESVRGRCIREHPLGHQLGRAIRVDRQLWDRLRRSAPVRGAP